MNNPYITIPLADFLKAHFGIYRSALGEYNHSWHSRPIRAELAIIFKAIKELNPDVPFHIEFPDELSPHLEEPILWDLTAWNTQCDKFIRDQKNADKRRVERFILEANIKIVARAFCHLTGCPNDERAVATAHKLLLRKNLGAIKALGVNRLIEKESEL